MISKLKLKRLLLKRGALKELCATVVNVLGKVDRESWAEPRLFTIRETLETNSDRNECRFVTIGLGAGETSIELDPKTGLVYYDNCYEQEQIASSVDDLAQRISLPDFPSDLYEARDEMTPVERREWRTQKTGELIDALKVRNVHKSVIDELVQNLPSRPYTEADGRFHLPESILSELDSTDWQLGVEEVVVGTCGNGDFVAMGYDGSIYFASHETLGHDYVKVAESPAEYCDKLHTEGFPFDYYEASSTISGQD